MEYRQKNKANRLVDRRFGEGDEHLSVEEKMMQRFILERKVTPYPKLAECPGLSVCVCRGSTNVPVSST